MYVHTQQLCYTHTYFENVKSLSVISVRSSSYNVKYQVNLWWGGLLRIPLQFFQIGRKQRCVASPFLKHLFIYFFRISCENSPHKKFECSYYLQATTTERLPWNLQRLIQVTVAIKCTYISEVWYRWPKVRSILWPLQIISHWNNIESCLFWTNAILNTLKYRFTLYR